MTVLITLFYAVIIVTEDYYFFFKDAKALIMYDSTFIVHNFPSLLKLCMMNRVDFKLFTDNLALKWANICCDHRISEFNPA